VIDALAARLKRFRDDRNWSQFHNPKDLAISVTVEASELLEIFQWRSANEPLDREATDAAADEIADVFLYLLMLCNELDVDLLSAAEKKIELNEGRFPVERSFGVAKPPKA
jgi:NTP pyrophosphatase (non-canonical NTP hydrolase)